MVIEMLIAISIMATSILAAMTVSQRSINVSRQAFHATQAAFLLEEGAEIIRLFRDNGWSNISSLTAGFNYSPDFSAGAWVLSETVSPTGIFTRIVTVANVNRDNTTKDIASIGADDPGTKLVTITVSWPEGSLTITKNLSFYLMDIFS